MSISIQDLLAAPALSTRLVSGASQAGRRLRWAHVCELPDPSQWLGEGELLMTTGIGIPAGAGPQREYIERLAAAHVAGLMIGENMQAPEELGSLYDTALRLDFPVLLIHHSVPFSAVARAIIDASRQEEQERRNAVTRIYESARMGLRNLGLEFLLQRLTADLHAQLYLFDVATLEPWHAGLRPLPAHWREALGKRSPTATTVTRLASEEGDGLTMALPSVPACKILACGGGLLDYGLLHHVTAVLGIELERQQVEHERVLRQGGELLDDLLQQRLNERPAHERLAAMGCQVGDAVFAVARCQAELPERWSQRLHLQGVTLLARVQGEELILLLASLEAAEQVQQVLGYPLGLSNPLGHAGRTGEALREARLALAHASANRLVAHYGRAAGELLWLPSSLEEALLVYRRALGALADYDAKQGAQLQHTLQVFLEQNRSWQKTAERLNVHRQTLVYRIRRIEEITGLSLDSTEDVAVLWIALRAGQISGIGAGLRE
ncbi:PucR family transcriptional regulator ligand-binding domain-containing protein [Pseudomonas sp. SCB32]|uniref:PucR family transcriptional regulator n=1 Tax=Pseudomonas sp. SCB32 TaxID=2653853 RepID=UPI00126482C4|nr:PucR family transcriptional regulator ligand-binding domain-containing protein [Pseudomonas sp. SCB32]